MRYCKKLTDRSIDSIARGMDHLYSLDLSFCTKLTATSIFNLLDLRFESLTELRLKHCIQLDIAAINQGPQHQQQQAPAQAGGSAGRLIANAIRTHPDHCLSILDVRECCGQRSASVPYKETDPFVVGLKAMGFEQRVPGFFSRPTRRHIPLLDQIYLTHKT